jgi:AcrR family transcriptional regulator
MSDNPRPNPRAERTRAALIAAGRRLFSEHSVDAVTVDDIVQAAEVGRGSFYNHFVDRESLLRAIASEIRGAVEQAVERANAEVTDPASRIARAVCTYLHYAIDDPERAGVLARIHNGHMSMNAGLNRGLVDDIATGLASGRFAVATSEAGVLYVLGITQIAFLRVLEEPSLTSTVALAQQMCALLLRGLGVPAADAERLAAQASDQVVRQGAFMVSEAPEGDPH